jgi:hypothetical protein
VKYNPTPLLPMPRGCCSRVIRVCDANADHIADYRTLREVFDATGLNGAMVQKAIRSGDLTRGYFLDWDRMPEKGNNK